MSEINDRRKAAAIAEIALRIRTSTIDKREVLTALIRAYDTGYEHCEDDYVEECELDEQQTNTAEHESDHDEREVAVK